jgi:hypothetical protein
MQDREGSQPARGRPTATWCDRKPDMLRRGGLVDRGRGWRDEAKFRRLKVATSFRAAGTKALHYIARDNILH